MTLDKLENLRGAAFTAEWATHLLRSERGRRAFASWALATRPADWVEWAQRWQVDPQDDRLGQEAMQSLRSLFADITRSLVDQTLGNAEAQTALDEAAMYADEEHPEEPPSEPA